MEGDLKNYSSAYVALGEVMVHGEDIRRPLGAQGEHAPEHLATLAEAYNVAASAPENRHSTHK